MVRQRTDQGGSVPTPPGRRVRQVCLGQVSLRPRRPAAPINRFCLKRKHVMANSDMNRRDFQRLTMAALGGALAGAELGYAADDKGKEEKNPLLSDPHVCRGINTCK